MSTDLTEADRTKLAGGLHALDCDRCHRGAYCGGIDEDDLGRADLLMDDVVTDLLAEHTQTLKAERDMVVRDRDRCERIYHDEFARAEAAEAEVKRLQRWKDEALPVIDGLQELGKALGIGLGQRITGPQALEAVETLQAELANTREITRLAEESETGWRREAEGLAVERNRLRAGIEALADTWDAMRARNGRPMLTTANVVDRLRALLGGGE